MQSYAIDLLKRMVETYSPLGEEDVLAKLLFEEMKGLGFEVELDAVGNVIGRFRGKAPRILLCGHMDTIPSSTPTKVENGILYGRGAVDAKAPLAAMIVAASQLIREGYKGELLVVGVVDEEGKGAGVRHLIKDNLNVDYAVFGEPTDVETVTIGYRGSLLLKVVCETETGHSSAPWLFENAIEKAMEIWNVINDLRMLQEKPESRFNSLSKCLRKIEEGGEGSIVPSRCEIIFDIRIPPSISVEQLSQEFFKLIDDYRAKNPAVRVEAKIEDSSEPYIA